MPDQKIQQMQTKGKFYLWSYKPEQKSNSGVHFTCSNEAIESFNLLSKAMLESKWPNKKVIELSETSNKQISICGNRARSFKVLIIKHDKKLESETFEVEKEDLKVTIKLSSDSLRLLSRSISKIKDNEGDYSLEGSLPFWLWWNLED